MNNTNFNNIDIFCIIILILFTGFFININISMPKLYYDYKENSNE